MLKIHFLHKNKLGLTSAYYYAFYSSKDKFDNLSELEKEMIRKTSGVEGFGSYKNIPIKKGFREQGMEYLKAQKIGNLVGSIEDLYYEFLTYVAETGTRKEFNKYHNKDHKKSGSDYNIDNYIRRLIYNFVKSRNSDKKNQSLYIESFSNDDNARKTPGTIDIDYAQSSIVSNYSSQSNSKLEIENITNKILFRDTLLLLKFFERKLSLNCFIQYVKAHDIKTNYAEISNYVKKGEGVKKGTLPRLNFEELNLMDGRSSFLKKIKRLNESSRLALYSSILDFLSIVQSENIQLSTIPDDIINDCYMFSLRNDTFLDLNDYIKNRRKVKTESFTSNDVTYNSKESECDIFKLTIDAYNSLNCKMTCGEITELLNANALTFKSLFDQLSDKYNDKIFLLKNKNEELKTLESLVVGIDKGIATRKYGKSDRFLNDNQIEKLKAEKKASLNKIKEIKEYIDNITSKENESPHEIYNQRYIKYLKMFKNLYMKIQDVIVIECAQQLIDDTKLNKDTKKAIEIFEVLKKKYKLIPLISNQDFLSMANKCHLNNIVYENAVKAKWHNLGDGWLGIPMNPGFKPILLSPDGILYKPYDKIIRHAYMDILAVNYNAINGSNSIMLVDVEILKNEYVAFVTENSQLLNCYIAWRNESAKNK